MKKLTEQEKKEIFGDIQKKYDIRNRMPKTILCPKCSHTIHLTRYTKKHQ